MKGQPVCCCAEEDVLCLDSTTHFEESVLVHELAHSVMNLGFDDSMLVGSLLPRNIATHHQAIMRVLVLPLDACMGIHHTWHACRDFFLLIIFCFVLCLKRR